jgi:hypothetical protein
VPASYKSLPALHWKIQLVVPIGKDTHLKVTIKLRPAVRLIWSSGEGPWSQVRRRAHRRGLLKGENIGDVFAVEQVIDAETDLRLVEDRVFFAEGVVQEEIDVVIRRNIYLIVIRTVVVVVVANTLLNDPDPYPCAGRLSPTLGVRRSVSHVETRGHAGTGIGGFAYGSIGIEIEAMRERGIGLRFKSLGERVRTKIILVKIVGRVIRIGDCERRCSCSGTLHVVIGIKSKRFSLTTVPP